MASSYKEIPLTFEKGLVTEIEESILDQGQASELTNWEATPQGGLRSRNAWESISKDGLPTTYNVRGFGAVAVGGAASSASGPQVVQTEAWPNANADPLATKTLTLTGCTIGNVLVAVATDNSGETPTTTVGWTERAISTAERQYVKFYTKTAASSTEAFTYTITTSRLRSLTLYEVSDLDAEDPGTKWAAATVNSGSGGTDTISATATDTDGGLAIIGTLYDGGSPNTTIGGTAGMTSVTQDNANTRTGITFDDLDQLDGVSDTANYVSPSWTPPDSGALLCIVTCYETTSSGTFSIAGNNLTWTTQVTLNDQITGEYIVYVFSADLTQSGKTTGSITVTSDSGDLFGANEGFTCNFIRVIGAATDPIIQSDAGTTVSSDQTNYKTGVGLTNPPASGSGTIGIWSGGNSSTNTDVLTIGTGWTAQLDAQQINNHKSIVAYQSPTDATQTGGSWNCDVSGAPVVTPFLIEVAGTGNASRDVHGTFTTNGTVTDEVTYIANKRVTHKLVLWGFVPPETDATPDQIDFNIVLALADGATTYKIYQIPREEITTGTWEQIDAITDAQSSSAWVSFAQGAGRLAWTASTMLAPRSIQLNPVVPSNISDMEGLAGRSAVYHKDRLFIGGSNDSPARLYFSDIGAPTDFETTTDFMDIGGDDGEAIQDLLSVEGLLLVAKTNRAYLVSGSGVESFFVNELPGGTAASGRPAVRTPFGTILAGTDDIWVVQGGGVDPMSRPLGDGYRITGNVSTAYGQDTALICDSGTNTVWRVNLVTGAWGYESVTGDDAANYFVWSLNGRLYYGTNDSDTQVGGTRQLLSPRNVDETTGDTHFSAATGRLALDGPAFNYTPRYLYLQTRAQDTSLYNELTITLTTNLNEDEPYQTTIPVTEATQRDRITMAWAKGAEWLKVGFVANSSEGHSAIDVEKIVLGVDVEAPR
jgi:hypothetical protein